MRNPAAPVGQHSAPSQGQESTESRFPPRPRENSWSWAPRHKVPQQRTRVNGLQGLVGNHGDLLPMCLTTRFPCSRAPYHTQENHGYIDMDGVQRCPLDTHIGRSRPGARLHLWMTLVSMASTYQKYYITKLHCMSLYHGAVVYVMRWSPMRRSAMCMVVGGGCCRRCASHPSPVPHSQTTTISYALACK